MWYFRRLLAFVCLAWAVLVAGPAAAQEAGAPVRLVAPQAGARLVAGSMAELEWAPLAGFDRLMPEVEEWEAFLSLDGGVTYPVRITPHLDQDLRRIRWQVPPIPARDARILLRLGNEHQETPVAVPAGFSISVSPSMLSSLEQMLLSASRSLRRGEPALPGHAGVVAWVEGSRRGGSLRQVTADEPAGLKAGFELADLHAEAAEGTPSLSPQASAPGPADGVAATPPDSRQAACSGAGTGPVFASDILLLIQRQNE